MAEGHDSSSNFKVVDRRSFNADGTRLSTESQVGESKAAPAEGSPLLTAAATPPKGGAQESREFEMLVSYLSTTAMFQLGLIAGPDGERLEPDPVSARQTIGFLEALQQKTLGNLTARESRLIEEVVYELRMSCLEMENRAGSKGK